MEQNVKSKNQSGGITAGTVNIEQTGNIGQTKKKRSGKMGWLGILAAVATIVGTIIVIFQFIGS